MGLDISEMDKSKLAIGKSKWGFELAPHGCNRNRNRKCNHPGALEGVLTGFRISHFPRHLPILGIDGGPIVCGSGHLRSTVGVFVWVVITSGGVGRTGISAP